jgi:hypothetical protein
MEMACLVNVRVKISGIVAGGQPFSLSGCSVVPVKSGWENGTHFGRGLRNKFVVGCFGNLEPSRPIYSWHLSLGTVRIASLGQRVATNGRVSNPFWNCPFSPTALRVPAFKSGGMRKQHWKHCSLGGDEAEVWSAACSLWTWQKRYDWSKQTLASDVFFEESWTEKFRKHKQTTTTHTVLHSKIGKKCRVMSHQLAWGRWTVPWHRSLHHSPRTRLPPPSSSCSCSSSCNLGRCN